MLKLEKITKNFIHGSNEIRLFNDFSFGAEKGDFQAICGPSGCGKTTLMLMIGALLKPDSGSVLVDNTSIYSLSEENRTSFRARKIGFVFQQFHLLPYFTVLENVMLPNLAHDDGDIRKKAEELITTLGLTGRISHFPSELSIGERQRTALARAMIQSPEIILADEPTGNLDYENGNIVTSVLRNYADSGKCVIMVTHDTEAARKADKITSLK